MEDKKIIGIDLCRNCERGRLDIILGDFCRARMAPLNPPKKENWCEYYVQRNITNKEKKKIMNYIKEMWDNNENYYYFDGKKVINGKKWPIDNDGPMHICPYEFDCDIMTGLNAQEFAKLLGELDE